MQRSLPETHLFGARDRFTGRRWCLCRTRAGPLVGRQPGAGSNRMPARTGWRRL